MADGSINMGLVVAGQLAASDTDIYAPTVACTNVVVELFNTHTADETVTLYKRIGAGTHFLIFQSVLAANGGRAIYVAGDMGSTTKLSGASTGASRVNCLVSAREYTPPS